MSTPSEPKINELPLTNIRNTFTNLEKLIYTSGFFPSPDHENGKSHPIFNALHDLDEIIRANERKQFTATTAACKVFKATL